PLYPVGCSTAFLEVWEQMGFRLPGTVVVACGYGSQVAGLLYALEALRPGGARCRVVAVNTARYPALTDAFASGATDTTAAGSGPTLAEGIACRNPVRGAEMLAGIRASGGTVVAVDDHAIVDAVRDLARVGALVEPTGAVAFAGWRHLAATVWLADPEDCCVVLSGSGLKTASLVADLLHERH
ncbi:MAG: pyridoxal-phosphate dependent enzyme, partial [Acidimicrobiales bacterium]